MSLVATYVRAVDGQLYRDPIIYGDGWFLCFDDEDPLELVVFKGAVWPKLDYITILHDHDCGMRSVPPKWRETKPAKAYWCALVKRIPVPQLHDGVVDREKITQGVIYDLGGSDESTPEEGSQAESRSKA